MEKPALCVCEYECVCTYVCVHTCVCTYVCVGESEVEADFQHLAEQQILKSDSGSFFKPNVLGVEFKNSLGGSDNTAKVWICAHVANFGDLNTVLLAGALLIKS